MTPEQHDQTIVALHDAVVELKATVNNGLKAMVAEQRSELKAVSAFVQTIHEQVSSHIAKEDVIFEIFKRAMTLAAGSVGALLVMLLAVIGWLLTHPNTWITP